VPARSTCSKSTTPLLYVFDSAINPSTSSWQRQVCVDSFKTLPRNEPQGNLGACGDPLQPHTPHTGAVNRGFWGYITKTRQSARRLKTENQDRSPRDLLLALIISRTYARRKSKEGQELAVPDEAECWKQVQSSVRPPRQGRELQEFLQKVCWTFGQVKVWKGEQPWVPTWLKFVLQLCVLKF
jgi:hypothetical protein